MSMSYAQTSHLLSIDKYHNISPTEPDTRVAMTLEAVCVSLYLLRVPVAKMLNAMHGVGA